MSRTTRVKCDVCGKEGTDAGIYQEGWFSIQVFRVVDGNPRAEVTEDVCFECYKRRAHVTQIHDGRVFEATPCTLCGVPAPYPHLPNCRRPVG